MSDILIKALQNPAVYPHDIAQFNVIQTHLSWVILTGLFAYKIKKPLNLGFQDYTTLEKRKYYCELELQLNNRLAAELYIGVVPITGTETNPIVDKPGTPIEYAVKMHQFSQKQLLTFYANHQKLHPDIFDKLALQIASFHQNAQICEQSCIFGTPEDIYAPIQDNFTALKTFTASASYVDQIEKIEQWAQQQCEKLKPILAQRKSQNFIRACHGDLHLGNIVMLGMQPLIFDCIEFNESFRWTDVMNDVGFLAMDLDHKGYADLRAFFVNKYFEYTNDYTGALLLKFYQSYRAMVRAKVASFQINQISEDTSFKQKFAQDLKELLLLGEQYAQPDEVNLMLTFGMSGSGKTIFTEQLLMQTGAIRLRSDLIRKHMHGLKPHQLSTTEQKHSLYSIEATKAVYQQLKSLAKVLLLGGTSVIIDAMCLKKWQRDLFFELSSEIKVPIKLFSFEAPIEVLRQRISQRLEKRKDVSEADLNVLTEQLNEIEPLTDKEKTWATYIDHNIIEDLIHTNEEEKHHEFDRSE